MRAARAPARRAIGRSRGTRAAPPSRSIAPIGPEPPLLDQLGLVPRWEGLSLEKVDKRLVPLVSAAASAVTAAVSLCRQAPSSALLSCYLRGSLPRGLFIEGVSDVDLIALVASDDLEDAQRIERAAARRLDDGDAASAATATSDARALVTKIEVRVHCLPLEGAAALQKVIELREPIPPSLVRRLMPRSLAFELATSAVGVPCQGGAADLLDLPSLLPDVTRLPPAPWLLPTIAADVRRAVDAARSAGGDTAAGSAAAVRWALKRSIRASLELQFLSRAAAAPRNNRPGLRWTRDLFYCAALTRAAADSGACRLSERVAVAVDEALELYVALLGEGGSISVAAASDHAERLADALDAAFLAAMLSEEPGWLTRHEPPPPPGGRRRTGGQRAPWWPFGAAEPTTQHHPDDAIASQPPLVLVGCHPPPVHVRISGPPRLQIDATVANNAAAATALASALASAKSMASFAAEPVLLRGLAANWPAVAGGACSSWSFSQLLDDDKLRGKARAAPSLAFPFCEPALRDVLVAARGAEAAPSLEVDVAASEFVRAMLLQQPPASSPPAALAGLPRAWARSSDCTTPYLYLQAVLLEGHRMHDAVKGGLDHLLALLRSAAPDACVVQPPRLWASVRGAVSPTHYDRDASLLVQIAGRKRMLLFPPDQLECLLCYPEQHLLRRRARVNLAAVEEDGGLRSRLCAIEVMLEPGDAVFFPPEWAHYTESLSPSMSVTTRFALRRGSE